MLRPHFSLHWSYAGSPTQPLAMSRSVSASLVSRSRYHYLVNRQRRRANTCTVHHTGVSHLTVITNLSFLYFISLLLICASIFPFCNGKAPCSAAILCLLIDATLHCSRTNCRPPKPGRLIQTLGFILIVALHLAHDTMHHWQTSPVLRRRGLCGECQSTEA